ncbi:signal transduction histidine kinase [Rhizobium sp. BK176]|nr:signal transduction histidine kinase [Rhizobium sp. BK399]MCS3743878.1 signal transduction histidine kinase [Rhizobium sp. BK661]MCS4095972.1 signal transduction histidine kinase [Rhizobium sp. BK176]
MPEGGSISLAVAATRHAPLSEVVELRIVDNGIGMDRETLRRASDAFFTTKSTGLGGFGLTIVGHFAQEIGGNLHLQSEIGIGTRATLVLPLRSRDEKLAL